MVLSGHKLEILEAINKGSRFISNDLRDAKCCKHNTSHLHISPHISDPSSARSVYPAAHPGVAAPVAHAHAVALHGEWSGWGRCGVGRFGHEKSGELTGCNWFSLGLTRFDCRTASGIEVLRCFKE